MSVLPVSANHRELDERPAPKVITHALRRYVWRVDRGATTLDALEAIVGVVKRGQRLKTKPRWMGEWNSDRLYFIDPAEPGVVVVVARKGWKALTLLVAPELSALKEATR